jgi:hypothetical protein
MRFHGGIVLFFLKRVFNPSAFEKPNIIQPMVKSYHYHKRQSMSGDKEVWKLSNLIL